jgi:hypothetical protein
VAVSSRSFRSPRPRRRRQVWGDPSAAACERLEDRVLLTNSPPTIADLTVEEVEDGSGYGKAYYLTGTISDDTPPTGKYSRYSIDIDLDGDGYSDASCSAKSLIDIDPVTDKPYEQIAAGSPPEFAYALPTPSVGLHQVAANVSELESDGVGGIWSSNGWVQKSYTVDPPKNEAPELRFVTMDTGYGGGGWISGVVHGEIRDRTPGGYTIQLDTNNDGVADQTFGSGRGAFSLGTVYVEIGRGYTARIKITETDLWGRNFVVGWQDVPINQPQPANVAPELGSDQSSILGYAGLSNGYGITTFSDLSGETDTKYSISQPRRPGHGSDGNFYRDVPQPGMAVDSTGKVTVGDAVTAKLVYLRDFKYVFSVVGDDGEATDSALYTLYDRWQYWIGENGQGGQAQTYADKWYGWITNVIISPTSSNSKAALDKLKSVVGDVSGVSGVATVAEEVVWAAADLPPAAAAAGAAISGLVLDLIAKNQNPANDDFFTQLDAGIKASVLKNNTKAGDVKEVEIGKALEKNEQMTRDEQLNRGGAPDAMAREAFQKFLEIKGDLPMTFKAPTTEAIEKQMLIDYASKNRLNLQLTETRDYNTGEVTYSWVALYSPGYGDTALAQKIATELNRLEPIIAAQEQED